MNCKNEMKSSRGNGKHKCKGRRAIIDSHQSYIDLKKTNIDSTTS